MKYGVNIQLILLAIAMCFFCIHFEANGQEQSSTLQDRDGNIYTVKILADNKQWMTNNLNINIPGSYGYENAEQKSNQYGRLYTWKSAQQGCKEKVGIYQPMKNGKKWPNGMAVYAMIRTMVVKQLTWR